METTALAGISGHCTAPGVWGWIIPVLGLLFVAARALIVRARDRRDARTAQAMLLRAARTRRLDDHDRF